MSSESLNRDEKEALLKLARDTIEQRVQGAPFPDENLYSLSERLKDDSGAFVSLHKNGTLRGCIGYIEPIAPLFKSVMDNAESAALRDTRFKPVVSSELTDLEIEISVLTKPKQVKEHTEIQIGKHGILLEKGWHRAVYLPQVAPEQGWDLETTLDHLAQKAGLPQDGWRNETIFSVFEAIVFNESELK